MNQRGHIIALPPSIDNVTPVIYVASSDAKKIIDFATSSTVPGRPRA